MLAFHLCSASQLPGNSHYKRGCLPLLTLLLLFFFFSSLSALSRLTPRYPVPAPQGPAPCPLPLSLFSPFYCLYYPISKINSIYGPAEVPPCPTLYLTPTKHISGSFFFFMKHNRWLAWVSQLSFEPSATHTCHFFCFLSFLTEAMKVMRLRQVPSKREVIKFLPNWDKCLLSPATFNKPPL